MCFLAAAFLISKTTKDYFAIIVQSGICCEYEVWMTHRRINILDIAAETNNRMMQGTPLFVSKFLIDKSR
jgi:uncharacterized protein (DUF779 family)